MRQLFYSGWGVLVLSLWLLAGLRTGFGQAQAMAFVHRQISQDVSHDAGKGAMQLRDALKLLESHYKVDIVFGDRIVQDFSVSAERVSLKGTLEENLSRILQSTGLRFRKIGNSSYAILARGDRRKQSGGKNQEVLERDIPGAVAPQINTMIPAIPAESFLPPVVEKKVSGRVTDEKGDVLPGVSILVKGTQRGMTTDSEGRFSIEVADENGVLVFSFVGYLSQEVVIGNRTSLEISLIVDEKSLEEVVVVGYGIQKKVNMTGAVDVVSIDQLENRQLSTVSQMLQGLSPALNFSAGNQGLGPGATMNVDIRGIGSLNGGSPLILIDGFPGDMDRLNPNDIESISILKDAAASAIYGARASFGVILIKTKGGKKNERLSVSYSGNTSINKPDRLPSMLDSYTYARVVNEMGDNGGGRTYDNSGIDRIIAYQNQDWDFLKQFMPEGVTHYEVITRPENPNRWGNALYGNANYDWYDEFYGHSVNQNHNVSLQGGSDKTSYFVSGGYVGQNGVLNYGTDYFKRFNITGKTNIQLTKWWNLDFETRFTRGIREHFTGHGTSGTYASMFGNIYNMNPTFNKYFGYGEYSIDSKIPYIRDSGNEKSGNNEIWQIVRTSFKPAGWWNIHADFAYRATAHEHAKTNLILYEPLVDGTLMQRGETLPSQVSKNQDNNSYWSSNIYSSFDFAIDSKHNFHGIIGFQLESSNSKSLTAAKTNLMVSGVPSLQTANGDATVSETLGHWATQGYFGRIAYNFEEKYLLEANARYDGTSRFQLGKRWGFFPSFSLGWNVDRESFWKGIGEHINALKIRASWGQLGNQQVAPYLDRALMPLQTGRLDWIFNYGQNRPVGYTTAPSIVSPNLTWETASTKNIGLNVGILQRKLQIDFDWFERITTDMIGPSEPLPGILGAGVPQSNNSTLKTKGWETSIGWNQSSPSRGLSYFLRLNLQDAVSVVTEYHNPSGNISGWYKGKKVGEIWGFTVNKLYQTQEELDSYLDRVDLSSIYRTWNVGDVKYEDINGDGRIDRGSNTLENPGDLSIIGNNTPRFQFGFNAGVNIGPFDASFLIRGTLKRGFAVREGNSQFMFWGVTELYSTALTPQHLDYFRDKPGDRNTGLFEGNENINTDAYWPKPYMNAAMNAKNRLISTRYLQNAAYIRLQNLQIGYSFSRGLLEKAGLSKARIFLSGENLLTLTKLLRGIDPIAIETGGRIGMIYGTDKMFAFGVNITL